MKPASPTKKQIAEQLFEEAKAAHAEFRAELIAKRKAAAEKCAKAIISMIKAGHLTVNHIEAEASYDQTVMARIACGTHTPLREAYDELHALPEPRRFDERRTRRKITASLHEDSIQEVRAFFSLPETKRKLRKIISV